MKWLTKLKDKGYTNVSVKASKDQIEQFCRAFDVQHEGKDAYISQEEFQYLPLELQTKVKASIFIGTTTKEILEKDCE